MKIFFICFVACLITEILLFTFRKSSTISPESPAPTSTLSVASLKKFNPANTLVIGTKDIPISTTEKMELGLNKSVKPAFSKKKQSNIQLSSRKSSKPLASAGTFDCSQAVSDQKTGIKTLVTKNDTVESIITPLSYDSIAQEVKTNGAYIDEKSGTAIVTVEKPAFNEKVIATDQTNDLKTQINAAVIKTSVSSQVSDVENKPAATFHHAATGYALSYAATRQSETGSDDYSWLDLYEKAEQLKAYAKQHKYNTEYGFIIHMGMKSGKKRFFVMDLNTMTIVKRGIVSHGRGAARFTLDKKYSNEKGSNCTSLGIYKIGKSYTGTFGASYKLHGLQESNKNAYERSIVLHTMRCIPDQEIDYPIFQSEGCPSVSTQFLKEISTVINKSSKPVLLWIFDPATENQASWANNDHPGNDLSGPGYKISR
jgi:hypothetical protein